MKKEKKEINKETNVDTKKKPKDRTEERKKETNTSIIAEQYVDNKVRVHLNLQVRSSNQDCHSSRNTLLYNYLSIGQTQPGPCVQHWGNH